LPPAKRVEVGYIEITRGLEKLVDLSAIHTIIVAQERVALEDDNEVPADQLLRESVVQEEAVRGRMRVENTAPVWMRGQRHVIIEPERNVRVALECVLELWT
jgi:hypothetical protein